MKEIGSGWKRRDIEISRTETRYCMSRIPGTCPVEPGAYLDWRIGVELEMDPVIIDSPSWTFFGYDGLMTAVS